MDQPKRYRKKPVVIEAMQISANGENLEAIMVWMGEGGGKAFFEVDDDGGIGPLVVETLEGNHIAGPADWIIRGVAGEFYPCKPEIFAQTYEEAD